MNIMYPNDATPSQVLIFARTTIQELIHINLDSLHWIIYISSTITILIYIEILNLNFIFTNSCANLFAVETCISLLMTFFRVPVVAR